MTIKSLDGQAFKNMVLAGAQSVIDTQEHLNRINVFPVPDGDTGSNMAAAFENIASTLINNKDHDLSHIAAITADAALNGSRGNSGAIIAQFFEGLKQAIGDNEQINLEIFSKGAIDAALSARNAISNPVEGTIITVMHDWAEWLAHNWSTTNTFEELLTKSLEVAAESLARTPEQLEILSKSHVVDAGAQGFVNFLQGITHYFMTGKLPHFGFEELDLQADNNPADQHEPQHDVHLTPHAAHSGDLDYQYCTECIIHGKELNTEKVRAELKRWGDSTVVIGSKQKIKIHIHTNAPNKVFRLANQFGEVLETKADDMWAQYRTNIEWHLNKKIIIVTDTSCNLPQNFFVKYNIVTIPLQVIINNKAYLDKINLSSEHFLEKLLNKKNKITTSQPALVDIKAAFNKAFRTSPTIIGIFLSSELSGTFNAISAAAKNYEEGIHLVDSRNLTGGLGLIVEQAARAIQQELPTDQVLQIIHNAIECTATFVSFKTIEYAYKSGRVKKSTSFIAAIFRLLPILKINSKGTVDRLGTSFGKRSNRRKMLKAALQHAKQHDACEFIVTHAGALNDATKTAEKIKKQFPKNEIHIVETSPILATYAGPGAIAVSVLGKN